MKVRRLDSNHDWTLGYGVNNYASESEAIAQCVKTRLWSFTNDWFLDLDYGLPWLEKSGRRVDLEDLSFKIKQQVLETPGVERISHYQAEFDPETRKLTVTIHYIDIYGVEGKVNY